MRIDIPMFDLSVDRIQQAIEHYLLLGQRHLIYHVECHIEAQPNKEEGEYAAKEKYIHCHGCYLKAHISGVTIDFAACEKDERYDVWCVEIHQPTNDTLRIKFETQREAYELMNTIQEWLLS